MTWTAQDQSNINCGSRKACNTRPPSEQSGGGHWHILLNTDERIHRTLWQGLHTVGANQTYQIRRKPHAVNGLLEAPVIVPVANTLMMRGSSCYHASTVMVT